MIERKEKIWQVSEVNFLVRDLLDQTILPLWLGGEIGSLTIHRSGHVYMTLKDASSQLRAVYFNGAAECRRLNLKTGDRIEAAGKPGLYAAAGEFQFNIRRLRLCGTGILQQEFENLKRRLAEEGLFAPERKKAIPFFFRNVGLITSPGGAAVRDFLKIALRRFPGLNVRICPAPVQGKGAELKLAAAIRFFNRVGGVDVIVLTRGGGSMEELWPFNEEVLARAIAASAIPVVSAVGHEIDFTIADFVADLRAPTPSGAAEQLIPETRDLRHNLEGFSSRIRHAVSAAFDRASYRLHAAENASAIHRLELWTAEQRQILDGFLRGISDSLRGRITDGQTSLKRLNTLLNSCSPENILRRGFAILSARDDGSLVSSTGEARKKRFLTARMADGTVDLDIHTP